MPPVRCLVQERQRKKRCTGHTTEAFSDIHCDIQSGIYSKFYLPFCLAFLRLCVLVVVCLRLRLCVCGRVLWLCVALACCGFVSLLADMEYIAEGKFEWIHSLSAAGARWLTA